MTLTSEAAAGDGGGVVIRSSRRGGEEGKSVDSFSFSSLLSKLPTAISTLQRHQQHDCTRIF